MKAFCNILKSNASLDLSFAHQHLFGALSKHFTCYTNEHHMIDDDTTHYIIMDLGKSVEDNFQRIQQLRKDGIKVILMVFDPISFVRIDDYINSGLLDKIILFDQKFQNRFNLPTYVSDYFFNEELFPIAPVEHNDFVCVFGHLSHERSNEFKLNKIDETNPGLYSQLYMKVQHYNGVCIYDTGIGEDATTVVHYNKAKAVETLMCGRNAYCTAGINTKNYNQYLKKFTQIPEPLSVDFIQDEIFQINRRVIKELIKELENA